VWCPGLVILETQQIFEIKNTYREFKFKWLHNSSPLGGANEEGKKFNKQQIK
jgi:hypothetical protein